MLRVPSLGQELFRLLPLVGVVVHHFDSKFNYGVLLEVNSSERAVPFDFVSVSGVDDRVESLAFVDYSP